MKNKITDNDIRHLIERWYSAETTPEEERLLRDWLINADSLPPDLESERKLFMVINDLSNDDPEIPEAQSKKISEALEKEMARERMVASPVTVPFGPFRKRIMWAAAGVAVAVAGVFLTPFLMNVEERGEQKLHGSLSIGLPVSESFDTIKTIVPSLLAKAELPDMKTELEKAKKKEVKRKYYVMEKSNPSGVTESAMKMDRVEGADTENDMSGHIAQTVRRDSLDDILYLSYEEEARLAGKNYRVVRDSREADRIMSSIFSRMEDNIKVEDAKLHHIGIEYDNVIRQTENANSLNKYNHEIQPI